jgi:hypothetical protein
MLRGRELQNRCAPCLSIFEDVAGSLSIRKKRCPVTPCVPACRRTLYCLFNTLALLVPSITPPPAVALAAAAAAAAGHGFSLPSSCPLMWALTGLPPKHQPPRHRPQHRYLLLVQTPCAYDHASPYLS